MNSPVTPGNGGILKWFMTAKEMLHGIAWTLIQGPWKFGDHMVVIFRTKKKLWDSYVYVVTNERLIKGWQIIFECSKVIWMEIKIYV